LQADDGLAKRQQVVQIPRKDGVDDGRFERLVPMHRDVVEADHALQPRARIGREPLRIGEQFEAVAAGLRDAKSAFTDQDGGKVGGRLASAQDVRDSRVLARKSPRNALPAVGIPDARQVH
jgi:hypothetical protein